MKRRALLFLSIFLVAVSVRALFWWQIHGTPLERWHRWIETDMATYLEQGRLVAAGDLLAVEPYHPYHKWQSMAPPAKWITWCGPHSFHQAPAYSYALALLRGAVARDSDARLARVRVLHVLIGGATSVLLALAAARLGGLVAAGATGLLAALYGPLYYLELQILREGPALAGIALILLLAVDHADARARTPARRSCAMSLALGAMAGAFWTLHEIGSLLFATIAAGVLAAHARESTGRARRSALWMSLGFLVGFAPLAIRNLAVGAGPFDVSCRTAINVALANAAGAPEGGTVFRRPAPETAAMLDAAADRDGRLHLAGVMREVARSYDGDVARMLADARRRFVRQWTPREVPDNTSFYFYREHAAVLATSPTFAWIMAPALAALVLALATVARGWKRAGAAAPGGLLVASLLPLAVSAALIFVVPVGRFRLYLAVPLLVHAGLFVAWLVAAIRERRPRRAALLCGLALLFAALQFAVRDDSVLATGRSGDRAAAAMIAASDGDQETALRFLAGDPTFARLRAEIYVLRARELAARNRPEEAARDLRRALAEEPGYPPALRGLEELAR